jgi:hypothetical protein
MVLLAPLVVAAPLGCRGRAQREMYEAKMAHEIRVLEDQLYEADYHNRVLIDKLERIKLKSEAASRSRSEGDGGYESIPAPVPSSSDRSGPSGARSAGEARTGDGARSIEEPGAAADLIPPELPDIEGMEDLGDIVDEGQPAEASELNVPSTSDPFRDDSGSEVERDVQSPLNDDRETGELLPAPGGPEPPGKRDTEVPPELPGEILPPSMLDGEPEEKPPGQILLPDSVQNGNGLPDQLRLHPSLSGGNLVDDKIENMIVVITVQDKLGRPLDLADYDVDGELSIAIFEADQDETEEGRLGRWDFKADQVADLIRSDPISGLHVPIAWQGRQPDGEEVVVHVRLRSAEDEMRCRGRIKVERGNAVAEWTPRGEDLR